MNAPLDAENLNVRLSGQTETEDGVARQVNEIVIEPSYVQYLRENGYTIEGVVNPTVVHTGSETAHLVMHVRTYRYPHDDSRLDVAKDSIHVPVCDCWSYRNNSNDVQEDLEPGGFCKHIAEAFKAEKAKADDNQQELEDV